jgi:hypothetical protein
MIVFLTILIFYLEDFKLSDNKLIKNIQFIGLITFVLYLIYIIYEYIYLLEKHVFFINDKGKAGIEGNINVVNPTFSISTEGAKAMAKTLDSVGCNLGLAGTVAAVAGGVTKVISKSSIPPFQKVGIVVGSAVAGGAIQSGFSAINRGIYNHGYYNIPKGSNSLIYNGNNSPLVDLLSSIETLNAVSLSLLFILIVNISFRYYVKEDFKLPKFFSDSLNDKLNHYIIKLVHLNRKVSIYYIILAVIVIAISLFFSTYFTSVLISNLDTFIDGYNGKK